MAGSMDEASHKRNFKPIVLRDLFLDKNPALGRWIPGCLFRWLLRILRIDFVNSILFHHGCKKDVAFVREHVYELAEDPDNRFKYLT
jgi:hypothetical protein